MAFGFPQILALILGSLLLGTVYYFIGLARQAMDEYYGGEEEMRSRGGPSTGFEGPPPSFDGPPPGFDSPPPGFGGPPPGFGGPPPPGFDGPPPGFGGPPPPGDMYGSLPMGKMSRKGSGGGHHHGSAKRSQGKRSQGNRSHGSRSHGSRSHGSRSGGKRSQGKRSQQYNSNGQPLGGNGDWNPAPGGYIANNAPKW